MSARILEILSPTTPQIIEVTVPGPSGKASPHGGVFFTNVVPTSTGNVGGKVYATDGIQLIACNSTTQEVTVSVLAITGHSSYTPTVTVNGEPVSLSLQSDRPTFAGNIALTLPASGILHAEHEDGATSTLEVAVDTPPVILSATFIGFYPGSQTELKENDTHNFRVEADMPVSQVQVQDYGAFKAATHATVLATNDLIGTIANRGNSPQDLPFRVRVQSPSGAWSEWFDSTNTVTLNNLRPSISIGTITYPAGQSALKGSEEATVANTVSNYDTLTYSSSQLAISDPTTFATPKLVSRSSGSYNISTPNFTITAQRLANGSATSASTTVWIADALPTVSISLPAARLRSGGNAGTSAPNHTVTLTASQRLASAPTLTAPVGTWQSGFSGSGTTWTRPLRIHDDDTKGTFSFSGLSGISLSNQEVTTIQSGENYTVGGFLFRVLTIAAFPIRSAPIGTMVVDTAKLRCTNLSKGASGSLNYTYKPTTDNEPDRYTITGGDTWYNCDGANASSNTTGSMQIELEEVV